MKLPMPETWKYVKNVKHLFFKPDDHIPVCGIGMGYKIPLKWKTYPKELEWRLPCKNCTGRH